MDALVETHDKGEIERALKLDAKLIGINNRDLRTFHTTLDTFKDLSRLIPPRKIMVAESGIFSSDHILELAEYGANAFLVGESLMRQNNVETAMQILRGQNRA